MRINLETTSFGEQINEKRAISQHKRCFETAPSFQLQMICKSSDIFREVRAVLAVSMRRVLALLTGYDGKNACEELKL